MSTRGAEFRKADLQMHSPRDHAWEGQRPEAVLGPNPSLESIGAARDAYCRAFLERCMAEGLRAIAVTDHHEGVYCYAMIEAKRQLEVEGGPLDLWVFPGMELTCKDSCQALVLFDADLPGALFEKARAKLGLPADTAPASPRGIAVEPLDYNIADLQDLLDLDQELAGRFIVFPHVKPGGHKTVLRQGFHKRFRELPYVGGYMDRTYPDDLNDADRRILDGEIPAWSSEKRGVFSSSDARHSDFRLIGKHATWIKLATPTAESLRQAMLAPDSRIRYEEPKLPSAVISSLTVQGSTYLKDGTYSFNQQMNAVIGGRGAGKSTLLEYIRFALGCSAIDGMGEDGSATDRLEELLLSTLDVTTGAISLSVLLNGAPVDVSRAMANRDVITVTTEGSSTLSSVDEVRRLIPTQQYRQGELSELAREDASDRLLQLVTGQAARAMSEIEVRLKRNGQAVSEALAKAVRLSAAELSRSHAETQAKLLKAQVSNLQKELLAGSLAATPAIAEHDNYMQQQAALTAATERLRQMRGQLAVSLSDFAVELAGLSRGQPMVPGVKAIGDAFEGLEAALQGGVGAQGVFRERQARLLEWLDETLLGFEAAIQKWSPIFEQHQSAYDAEKAALQGKQSVLQSIESLNDSLRTATQQLEAATQEEASLRDADGELGLLRSERIKSQSALWDMVEKQAGVIARASSGLARGQLSAVPDFSEAMAALRYVLDVPMLRESRIEKLAEAIRGAPDVPTMWASCQDELVALVKWKEGAPGEKGVVPKTPILFAALEEGFMAKLREKISADRVAMALRALVRPRVEIFQVREGAEIEFRKASQGEQAATLLNILMNQSNGPLIVDQPEEDLDNRIINDIIQTIRKTKAERQLILATHNANIAVNGDAENVIEMVLGERRACGAIDEADVRSAITTTMEGGKDAFELRRKKYNF